MGRILYIFPHPDDESFGPGPVIARQRREGHEVHLFTLTRGEATSQREKHGYSKEEMGEVRYEEMQNVARALDLTSMDVLELPDGGLDLMDPIELEKIVRAKIEEVRPDIVVTYYTHGISGHLDHLVTHAVVKRAFCALQSDGASYLKRLALFTLDDDPKDRPEHLRGTPMERIDCVIPLDDEDLERGRDALSAYETYKDVIEAHRPLETIADGVCFVFFGEPREPQVSDLFEGLDSRPGSEAGAGAP